MTQIEIDQEWLFNQSDLYSIWINNSKTEGKWEILPSSYIEITNPHDATKPYLNTEDICKAMIPLAQSREPHQKSLFRIAKISRYMVDGKHITTHITKVYT